MPNNHATAAALDAALSAPGDREGVRCTVDLDADGRSVGHFSVPWSRDASGWGNLLTPIAVIAQGDGPTVLLTGGNHGDEFEGPIALRRLIHELDPDSVSGRIMIVPGLNQAALRVGRRLSPIDNGNSNRLFPGHPEGSPTERVVDFVYRELVKRADIVLDIHSGGQSMVFEPMIATHQLDDPAQAAATAPFLKVFGTRYAVVVDEPDAVGTMDRAVESLGKIFLTTEIWGGRSLSARTVDLTYRGVCNTLRQAGVVPGEPEFDAPPTYVRMVDSSSIVAPCNGLFEPLVDPGVELGANRVVARIHPIDDLASPPVEIRTEIDGVVLMRHNPGLIEAGDPVIAVAVHASAPWESE